MFSLGTSLIAETELTVFLVIFAAVVLQYLIEAKKLIPSHDRLWVMRLNFLARW